MSKTFAHRLSEGWHPLQSMTGPACRRPLGRGASQEFLPLQRMRRREPTHPGVASSRFWCGCRVSHPLAAFRLPRPSDLFRPVTLMGFPLRSFSLRTEPWRLSTLAALLPLSALGDVAEATCGRLANAASGPCSPPESVTIERGLAIRPLAAPLGFPRSRAFLACVAAGFPAAPLSGFRGVRLAPWPPGLPGYRSARAVLRSSIRRSVGAATLLRFPHLVSLPRASSRAVPGSRRAGPRHRCLEGPLQGTPAGSPGGLADGMSVPDTGRHPTLDGIIADRVERCQTIEGNRVTRLVTVARNSLERGGLQPAR